MWYFILILFHWLKENKIKNKLKYRGINYEQ